MLEWGGTFSRHVVWCQAEGGTQAGPLLSPRLPALPDSQQPVPEQLRIQVSRVSMHDYEALHYDKEQLKEACECRGVVWQGGQEGMRQPGPPWAGLWDAASC